MTGRAQRSEISADEWDVICAVEEFWHINKFFPSADEISKLCDLSANQISTLLQSEAVRVRLEARGIDYESSPRLTKGGVKKSPTRLSDKQLAVAMCILNLADTRSLQDKLRSLGVQEATYHGWSKSHVFQSFMQTQMEDMFGDAMPLAHRALISKVINGDLRAIKLFYELTGRYKSAGETEAIQNVKLFMIRLIEILQRHVRDPGTLAAIAEEMKELSPDAFPGESRHSPAVIQPAEIQSPT